MSTLKADTIVASDGSSPVTLTKQHAAKVWATWNATTPALLDSFSVSTLTDNGTGDFTISHSSSFATANVYRTGGHTTHTNGASTTTYLTNPRSNSDLLTGSSRYNILYNTSSATGRADYAYCSTACLGDLA